jgi:acyl-CoA dehydrogenase
MCLLLVRTTPLEECAKPTDGMTLLMVDLQKPEVDITPIPKLGRNAVVSCEVRYDGLRVPVSRRVGEEGQGFKYLLDGLNPERILIASEALGIGRAAMNKAVNYAAELAVREASWRFDQGLPCGEAANTAKYLAAEAAFFACDRAMQTHGGMGYAREYHVERYWREARLMKIAPVSQEMVCNYIGTQVLGLPKSY